MKSPVGAIAGRLLARGEWLATAESCTGGLIAKLLTDRAGSSAWFERGFVTYSNRAKQQLLRVPAIVLERNGAVSGECAAAMAAGALRSSPAQWSIAVTGIAGPSGGTRAKPVGTVWIAWCRRGRAPQARKFRFTGTRAQIRAQSAQAALEGLLALLS